MRHKGDRDSVDARIAVLAGRQGGVASTKQLLALGSTAPRSPAACGEGGSIPSTAASTRSATPRCTRRGRWFAAVLACGPHAVLSHRSAGAAWELRPVPSGPVDVSVPPGGRKRRAGLRLHRTRLAEREWTTLDGHPVTTPERTLLDLAPLIATDVLERAVEQAEWRRLTDRDELHRLAGSGRPGAPALRTALAEPVVVTRSVLERRMLGLCRRFGLPRPQVNAIVCGYEVDVFWPEARLVVETDGGEYHRTRRAFEEDRRRDADLTAAGHRVVRLTTAA